MAYTVTIFERCAFPGCTSKASATVMNSRNAPCGKFCQKHAAQRVKALNRLEEQAQEVRIK